MTIDFWVSSGHHLTDRDKGGGLVVTDDFIKAFLARPELLPPDEACPVERGVHAALLQSPRALVSPEEITAIADEDARENLSVFLRFRDRLLAMPTLEAAYMSLYSGDVSGIPPLFLQQLTHVIARNAFDQVEDVFVLRAAECFFRSQRVSFHEGQVLMADAEAISVHEHSRAHSPLLSMLGGPAVSELEILSETNAAGYRARSDAHDMVLNIASSQTRAAMGEAARIWIRHLCGIDLTFEPTDRFRNQKTGWFLAFDAEGARIGNAVWSGEQMSDAEMNRVVALYRFTLPDSAPVAAAQRGSSGFAVMATTPDHLITIKPQNLVIGLPLEAQS